MKKLHIKALDAMRVFAISAVVLAHTTTRTLETVKYNLTGYPWTLFLNQIARFAVPLFFIVSGFSLELNYDEKAGYFSFLKKRLSRIFIPYVFWSAIYYLLVYNHNSYNFLKVLYLGDASYQLYFIPALFIFYLMFPLLHKFYNFLANKWVLLTLVFSEMFFLHQDYFVTPYRLDDPIHTVLLCYFVFILGMVAARNKDSILEFSKRAKYILASFTALFAYYVFWEGFTGFLKTGNYLAFYSNFRPSTLVFAVFLGLLLYYIFENPHKKFPFIQKLSEASFFVFFIHVIILENVWTFFGKSLFAKFGSSLFGKIIFDPLFFITVLGVSFFLSFIIRKIPFVSKITG